MQFSNQSRKKLNKLCKVLDRDYNINNGGCCFVALVIAKHLERLNIPYKLIVFDYIKKDKKEVKYELDNKVCGLFSETSITGVNNCNHYCLKIDCGFINVSGLNRGKHQHSFKVDSETIEWIYEEGNWNDAYDTDFNSEINYLIYKFFKDYYETE